MSHQPNRRTAAFIPCVVALVALAGCGSDTEIHALPEPLTGGPGGPSITVPRDDPSVSQLGDTVWVQMIDHGAEPHRQLRLQPTVGDIFHTTERYAVVATIGTDGRSQLMIGLPPFVVEEQVTIINTSDDEVTFEAEIVGSFSEDSPTFDSDELDATLEGWIGLKNHRTVTTLGVARPSTSAGDNLDSSEVVAAKLEGYPLSAIDQLPLPVEAIGLGARWRVESLPHSILGVAPTPNLVEFELVELTETHATATFETTSLLRPVAIADNAELKELVGGTITGTGTVTWRFDRPFPSVEFTGEAIYQVRSSGSGGSTRSDANRQIHYLSTFTD